MTIQQNIDYRVSVMDKVGVKIMDADGTQRPITSDDLSVAQTICAIGTVEEFDSIVLGNSEKSDADGVDRNFTYLAASINTRGEMYIHGLFANDLDAHKLVSELQAGHDDGYLEFFVERHEVRS